MEPVTIALALMQYAPSLIKWMTGNDKAENVAKAVVDIAQKVTGSATGEGSLELIKTDPKLAAEFADRVEQRQAELEKAYLADVDSARKMQIAALSQDDIFSKRFVYYFAAGWSVFSMAFFIFVTFCKVENPHLADVILGFLLGTAIAAIFNFFYGSTKKSQERSDHLYKSIAEIKQ